ncbi:MAG: archease [Melioribacteraceae bacterium]|nr:MAG: archease [Melioribacteraceae bacterium]
MYNYKFIEHTADIAVELTSSTIEELFLCAVDAWNKAMLDAEILYDDEKIKLDFEAESLEELLVNFLSEINYLFLSKKWFCTSVEDIKLHHTNNYKLTVRLAGLTVQPSKIDFKEEIKAITYHRLEIKKEKDEYTTRIIFDI